MNFLSCLYFALGGFIEFLLLSIFASTFVSSFLLLVCTESKSILTGNTNFCHHFIRLWRGVWDRGCTLHGTKIVHIWH